MKFMWPDAVRRRVWECREWFIESQVYTYSNTSLWSRVSLVFVRPHRVKQVHRGFGELFSNTVEDASSRLDLTHHDGLGFHISTVVSWGGIVLATETVDVSNWNILQVSWYFHGATAEVFMDGSYAEWVAYERLAFPSLSMTAAWQVCTIGFPTAVL